MLVKGTPSHYGDVTMGAITSQITSLMIVYSTIYSGADQSKHQSSASLAFVWEIHRGPVNFPHKWPVTRKMFPFDDVIMSYLEWYHTAYPTEYVHVLFCSLFCSYHYYSLWCHGNYLPISKSVASLILRHTTKNCPSASETTLPNMGKIRQYPTTTTHNKAWTVCTILRTYCVRSMCTVRCKFMCRPSDCQLKP